MTQRLKSSRQRHALDALKQTRAELLQIRFRHDLLQRASVFQCAASSSLKVDEITRLHLLTTAAELYDYLGRFPEALQSIEAEAEQVREQVQHIVPVESDRALWKQRLWLLLSYADGLYWAGRLDDSINLVDECRNALAVLNGPRDRSLRMQARLALARGRALRQLDRLDEAIDEFMNSTHLADRRLAAQIAIGGPHAGEIENHWLIARGLVFGIGWIAMVRGEMSNARLLTMSGRALLRATDDGIRQTYAEMQAAAIERVRAGTDRGRLLELIGTLKGCHSAFGEWGHRVYRSRAAFELALAHFHAGNRAETEVRLGEVKEGFADNPSVLSRAFILESRLAGQDIRKRLGLAEKALHHSQVARDHLSRVESLVAIGEAHHIHGLQLGQAGRPAAADSAFRAARQVLEQAREQSRTNKKQRAVICLHLSRVQAGLGEHSVSEASLRAAEALCRDIEWRLVREMVEAERDSRAGAPFLIPSAAETLDYKQWQNRMQRFLVQEAERRTGKKNEMAVARTLGVSRPTLYEWRRTWLEETRGRSKSAARRSRPTGRK